jgi:hypothetical protein
LATRATTARFKRLSSRLRPLLLQLMQELWRRWLRKLALALRASSSRLGAAEARPLRPATRPDVYRS